jgi:UPF0755 protein
MISIFKSVRFVILLGAAVVVISCGSLYFWWTTIVKPVKPGSTEKIRVVIPQGASAAEIGLILADKKLIKDPFVFRIAAHLNGASTKIASGDYSLSPASSLAEIFTELEKGPLDIWVTIPEGWRREQIAARLEAQLTTSAKKFSPQEFLSISQGMEGKLFPDTYLVPQTADAQAIIAIMTGTFAKKTQDVLVPPYPEGLTEAEVLTLASIIERETKGNAEERATVAGILLKRLKSKWALQADATIQFARDTEEVQNPAFVGDLKFWQPVSSDDKKIQSPFNTYENTGLPPGPIANPGLVSLSAAMHPSDSPYWYYLHDAQGNIHYAKTIQEHNQNVAKFLMQ